MQLKYVDTKEEIIAVNKKSKHIEPHLHNALEIVCVTSGTLELGVGQELYHMEKGAMKFTHRYIGTPMLNLLIRLKYKTKIYTDKKGNKHINKTPSANLPIKCPSEAVELDNGNIFF